MKPLREYENIRYEETTENIVVQYFEKEVRITREDKLLSLKFLLLEEYARNFSKGSKKAISDHIRMYLERDLIITPVVSVEGMSQGVILSILGSPAKASFYIGTMYSNSPFLCLMTGKKYYDGNPFTTEVYSLLKDLNLSKYYRIAYDAIKSNQLVVSEDDFKHETLP